ncbi:MAG: alpha/beta fold hydrolase [Anaerolineae bacterium]|nr:alpha/beta fold hydrolase [Anaerolineae bacterium]
MDILLAAGFVAAFTIYWLLQWRSGFFSTRYYLQLLGLLLLVLIGTLLLVQLWIPALPLALIVLVLTGYHAGLFGFKLLFDADNKYRKAHRPNRALVQYPVPHQRLTITTADGVKLSALHLPHETADRAVIVCHGAGRSKNTMGIMQTCTILATRYAVFPFDFRGHMESGGLYHADNSTEQDLNAVIDYVRGLGYERIAVFGWSVGASTALLAAANGSPIAAIVAAAPPPVSLERYHLFETLRRYPFLRIPGTASAAVSRYMRVSPRLPLMNTLDYADRVPPIPIFMAYNDFDTTLKISVEAFERLLEHLPPSTEAMHLPGSGHVFDWPNTFFFWQRMMDWLEANF